ncbi:MAG: Cys-tRNA(Pro) deacylase [Desulfopila sp.]
MTPAIILLEKRKIPHTVHAYQHEPSYPSFGLEASEKLGIPPKRVFKTLVVALDDGTMVVAIIPVDQTLSMKRLAKAAKAKKAVMADGNAVGKTTGYVLGGVSPLAQKKSLKTYLDVTAASQSTIFVSGGRRGLEIELVPADLLRLTRGVTAHLCQEESEPAGNDLT